MAQTWYPVIDVLKCTQCGNCVRLCPADVYDGAKAPEPVVARPEACIRGCYGCGNCCPTGAITFAGDDTGWTPPLGGAKPDPGCAGCTLFCGTGGC